MLNKIRATKVAKAMKKFGIKKIVDKEVHKHEEALHPGKPLTKLKDGGTMSGKKSHKRLDKLARGGKHGTKVNVIVAPQGGKTPVPVPVGAPAVRPAIPQAIPQAPQPGLPTGMKKGGKVKKLADGGETKNPTKLPYPPTDEPDTMPDKKKRGGTEKCASGGRMTAGAGSGEGRLEKIKNLPANLKSKKGI